MIRSILASLLFLSILTTHSAAEAVPVKIVLGTRITRGGDHHFVKDAAGTVHLEELVVTGGTIIRT